MASHAFALPADGSGWASRAAVRESCRLEPLIDGIPAFQRMERTILGARRTVHLSAWVFQPETPLKSREARREGASWGDLLVHVARRGVQVRLLLSALDPYFKEVDHRASWQAARALWDRAAKFPEERQGKLQVICTMHEATVETGIATVIGPRAQALVARLNKYRQGHGKGAALARYADMPGIWRNVRWRTDRERFELVRADDLVIHPASHHQKTCIVDGHVAYCGGLDIARGRLDTPEHKGMLWHDIACEIEGDAASDIERNFLDRWNLERERYLEFVAEANALKRGVSIAGMVPTEARLPPAPSVAPGSSQVQVLRTLTGNARWSRLPSVIRSDIEDAHAVAIGQARQYVYLENQYLREPAIVKWFRDCDAIDRLQVILVLPVAPEEAAASPIDEVTLHGLYLQRKVLTDLRTLLGDRLGVYSMVQRKRSGSPSHPTTSHGSTQIYVHSKCLIVDDEFAIIGSANATRRSFRVDSELSVGWFDPERVAAFRRQLWNELLGSPQGLEQWPLSGLVWQWEQIASGNDAAAAAERRGFIVRHDPDRKAVRGQRSALLPDEFADLGGGSIENELPV